MPGNFIPPAVELKTVEKKPEALPKKHAAFSAPAAEPARQLARIMVVETTSFKICRLVKEEPAYTIYYTWGRNFWRGDKDTMTRCKPTAEQINQFRDEITEAAKTNPQIAQFIRQYPFPD